MNFWSNIEISSQDPEIMQIDLFEKKLGRLPGKVLQIRELITRFEACHFKYQNHLQKIRNSVLKLEPETNPAVIGMNHPQKGENAWKGDKTGRSKTGQQYIHAIKKWLDDETQTDNATGDEYQIEQMIKAWLGERNDEKARLVRLLAARLKWDWKAYEELQQGGLHKELEFQVCRMDICHYNFPVNLNMMLQAIGNMKPVEAFEGCGSFNDGIRLFLEKEFSLLNKQLQSYMGKDRPDRNEMIRVWLTACLAKTIKEQVHLTEPVVDLV
jgi:hypothetical protein